MTHQRWTARRTRITSMSVGVLLLAVANSGCGPLADAPSGVSARAAQSDDLRGCPDLRRTQHDPVSGKDCVRALQHALHDNGYSNQPVTGAFAERTEANVLDFQRHHNIRPVNGIVGLETRTALLGGGTPPGDSSIPQVPPTGYSRHSYCADGACHFYLRRSTTSRYAQRLDAHPALGSAVSGALLAGACQALQVIKSAAVVCGLVGGGVADYVGSELSKAAEQHACLRLSVGLLSSRAGWRVRRLLEAAPDSSWRCSN